MFDANETKNRIVNWIRDWFAYNGPESPAVIGISGGKDSSVVAALCVEALGADRVFGVLLPRGKQPDIQYAYDLCLYLGIRFEEMNIDLACNTMLYNVETALGSTSEQARINLPARVRMCMLYLVSQSMNGRVANTCNLSEDYVGYSTIYGDTAGDFAPLKELTSEEVVEIGRSLGLPEKLVAKTPSDGLCGKTDEENLGFTYKQLNKYIRTGLISDERIKQKIDKLHEKNRFKDLPISRFHNYSF